MKLKIIHYAAILLLVAGTFSSCGEKDNMPQFSFTEFSLEGMKLLIDYDAMSENRVIVINSMQELEKYMEYGGKPDIDFKTHSMLLVTGVVEYAIAGAGGSVEQLAEDEYRVNVEVNTRFHPLDPQLWSIAFITSNLSDESVIIQEITLTNLDLDCSPTLSIPDEDCLSFFDFNDRDGSFNIIFGRWKLIKILSKQRNQCFDYSQCNIVVEFNLPLNPQSDYFSFRVIGKTGNIVRSGFLPSGGIEVGYINLGISSISYHYWYYVFSNKLVIDGNHSNIVRPYFEDYAYSLIRIE